MPAPFEVIAAPIEIYLAPVGEAVPDLADAPAGNWALLGTSGDENQSEDGVMVTHSQSITPWTPNGLTVPKKAFRESEGVAVAFSLVDMTAEHYAKVMNNATVTDTAAGASTAGKRHFQLYRGYEVAVFALLARGQFSPYADAMRTQWWIPRVYEGGDEKAPVFKKAEPAELDCEFMALWDSTHGLGRYEAQDAAPTG